MEQKVLDEADMVVAVSPLVQQEFQAMTQTQVELVTNGYDECDFHEGPCEAAYGCRRTAATDTVTPAVEYRPFSITHTGLFAADGNPTVLWDVLGEKCRKDENFRSHLDIRLIGKTDHQILEAIEAAGLSGNLTDLGYQPHSVATQEQREASLLILPLRKEPEYKAVLPGKLFEYLASWRPVLGIGQPDGAMSMILNKTKTGVVFDWNDRASMVRLIDWCWERHLKGELKVDDADLKQFTRRELTRRMAALFEKVCKTHNQK